MSIELLPTHLSRAAPRAALIREVMLIPLFNESAAPRSEVKRKI
jgi:hypothetical protein